MNKAITVLLIEDNPGDVRLVQEALRGTVNLKINLLLADTLEKGRKLIAAEHLHVIILDLNLPDSKGINTFKHIRKFAMDVPIIILSIQSDKETIYQALKEGAQDYLIKGHLENEALVRAIRYASWSFHVAD